MISGRGSNMVSLVEAFRDRPQDVTPAIVLSNVPGAAGLDRAAALSIPTATVDHRAHDNKTAFETAIDAALRTAEVDLVCLAGFMRILSPWFVERWQGQVLNIHPSLLPSFRGLDTHARALAARVTLHGVTVHEVTADLDDGPILGQAAIRVRPDDTAETLARRLLPAEHALYPAAVAKALGLAPLALPTVPGEEVFFSV
ncbi:MAG: phosphoribosylglycinamide formyltransferase [Pseudomonadota bacterium]